MVNVAILGATGYTALELIKILLRNPQVEITALTTRQEGSPPVHTIHQSLTGRLSLRCEDLSADQIAERAEFVFCALPHVASMEIVPRLIERGVRVVDLSADYRLKDPAIYAEWYGHQHTDLQNLDQAVYGLPELWADRIPQCQLVANPGCYTSTSILSLAPLLCEGLIEPDGIIIDAKSGVSGAGRAPKLNTLFSECNESLSAYSVGKHRHTPEIEQVLSDVSAQDVTVTFTPHLIPMDRGILCTIYPRLKKMATQADLLALYRKFYAGKPFVRVVDHLPATKDSSGTNFFDVTVRFSREQLIVIGCLDNLIKGAAGVAVQNFNLMAGFDETTGLLV
ncbi:MAG: N-acetyl-gamma-glutamyl-phosphate reductase [Planctomycetaceae bacterium]